MTESCLFCKIVHGDLPANKIHEDEQVVVFKDIHPKAAVHLLLVPKVHLESLMDARPQDASLLGHMAVLMPQLAKEQGLTGFRAVINNGASGGQEIPHLHFHLLGGPSLPRF